MYGIMNKVDLLRGIDNAAGIDEGTLLLFPDAVNLESGCNDVQAAALMQCEKLGNRFAILDVPEPAAKTESEYSREFRSSIGTNNLTFGAAYTPFLKVSYSKQVDFGESQDIDMQDVFELASFIPPSGAIAGVIAATDSNRGVWAAPANVSLRSVSGLTRQISSQLQDELTVPDDRSGKSINTIRFFEGRGIMVWGARTLKGDSPEWRYIPTRRLFNFVITSVKKATSGLANSSNDANTWQNIQHDIENFLNGLWREGALRGASPGEAYFVNVGLGRTMTEEDINNGKMIIDIGLAAVIPAEFIVSRVEVKAGGDM